MKRLEEIVEMCQAVREVANTYCTVSHSVWAYSSMTDQVYYEASVGVFQAVRFDTEEEVLAYLKGVIDAYRDQKTTE